VVTVFILSGVLLALFARPVLDQTEAMASELYDPGRYVTAVMGPAGTGRSEDGKTTEVEP
jgi:hypothetical protein